MEKLKSVIQMLFGRFSHPMFLLFLFLAGGMWYLSKLSHTYTASIELPMLLENSYAGDVMVIEERYRLRLRVEGEGYKLLLYTLFPNRNKLTVTSGQLRFENSDDSQPLKRVTLTTLADAVAPQLRGIKLVSVENDKIEVVASEATLRTLPVLSTIEIHPKNQYMQVGPLILTPDSVEVRGLREVLDTMKYVSTQPHLLMNVDHTQTGRIALTPVRGVTYSTNEVGYRATIDGYTEMELRLPVQPVEVPHDVKATVMPQQAVIRLIVNEGNYHKISAQTVRLYIKYSDRHNNSARKYKVYHSMLPLGVREISIDPTYVNVLFESGKP